MKAAKYFVPEKDREHFPVADAELADIEAPVPIPDISTSSKNKGRFLKELKALNEAAGRLNDDLDFGKLTRMVQELRMVIAGDGLDATATTPARSGYAEVQPMKVSPNQHVKRQLAFSSTKPAKRRKKDNRCRPDFEDFSNISQDLSKIVCCMLSII